VNLGQKVYIKPEESSEDVEFKYENGILEIKEFIPTLKAVAQDASENIATASANPFFAPK